MLISSSTSWSACQKKRYGEMVVPEEGDENADKGGIQSDRRDQGSAKTFTISGFAKRAAPMYASRARSAI